MPTCSGQARGGLRTRAATSGVVVVLYESPRVDSVWGNTPAYVLAAVLERDQLAYPTIQWG